MQSTPNYLWQMDDILGQGATASVYKARNKKSGGEVAVKVFNNVSYLRPYEVQMREFEMLRKLNHRNIVKLFAVEETGSSKQKVLIMEYCSSGSLLTVLEEPENAFGLSESEFLIVVQCVVAGMNHLRQYGVVHRDIKPGNIMRLIGEDGRSIYKLTDFGAARELEDDEKFISIYGTEEYLHPDMYERAVLRKPQQKVYGVTVDLWSIGVTFYHAACGSLPFIPYGGPRRNKETMHKITTEKPHRAIAGVQKREDGPIEWIYELPVTCRLSMGLRVQLESILPNILEADQEKCWGFEQFFAETNNVLQRMVIHVFSLPQASTHRIYVHTYNTLQLTLLGTLATNDHKQESVAEILRCSAGIFLDLVSKQTGVAPQSQRYFYEGHYYSLDPNLQVRDVSRTTEQNPLVMMSSECYDLMGVIYRDPAFDYPRFLPTVDVMSDCSTAKSVLSAVYQTLRVSQALIKCQEFILRGTYWLIENMNAECRRIFENKSSVLSILTCLKNTEGRITQLCSSVYGGSPEVGELQEQGECRRKLQSITNNLSSCSRASEKESILGLMHLEVTKFQDQLQADTSIQRMEHCLQKMQLIYKQFKKRRLQPRLVYNEEQIHKLDKINLGTWAKKVRSIFQDEVVQKYQESLAGHSNRMRLASDVQKHLILVSGYLGACVRDLGSYEESANCAVDRLAQKIQQMSLVPSTKSPPTSYLNQTQVDLALRMLQLRDQMKTVTCELEQNNSVIER
ncbi:inhibitor of nuclear factor kappa-B kinase subunit epsilon isoform X3 [Ascaphus truei]